MILGRVPLKDAAKWSTHEIDLTNETHIGAMAGALNVWFIVSTNQPLTGSICIDRVGFKVR
jgi:hypothetical protein